MKVDQVKNVNPDRAYLKERFKQSIRTGAVVGVAISLANDVFHHKNIANTFTQMTKQMSKPKAAGKIGGMMFIDAAQAGLVYGIFNLGISCIIDIFSRIGNKNSTY